MADVLGGAVLHSHHVGRNQKRMWTMTQEENQRLKLEQPDYKHAFVMKDGGAKRMNKPNRPITYNFIEPITKNEGTVTCGAVDKELCVAIFSGTQADMPVLVPIAALVAALTDACGGPEMLETFAKMLEGGEG